MSELRVFTVKFIREVVWLAKESGNLSGTTRDLCVPMSVLQRWKKMLQDDKPSPLPGQEHPAVPKLARLQRENA